jgi:hypothetical protein
MNRFSLFHGSRLFAPPSPQRGGGSGVRGGSPVVILGLFLKPKKLQDPIEIIIGIQINAN